MKKLAFFFPGQGSQYVGMAKKLYDRHSSVKQLFKEADDTLGFSLSELCFNGKMEELTKTENTQPAILTASYAAFIVYIEKMGIKPEFMAGHSLGEITALTCSGAIKFSDALKIVKTRGKLMQEAVPLGVGSMAALSSCDHYMINEICKRNSTKTNFVVISNFNSLKQTVISGHKESVENAMDEIAKLGIKVVPLKVSAPFHSPLMQPAADRFREELNNYVYNDFKYPVISNVTALPYDNKDDVIDNLCEQIVKPVKWLDTFEFLKNQGVEAGIELGPKAVLKGLAKEMDFGIQVYSFDNDEDVMQFNEKYLPNSKEVKKLQLIRRSLGIAVCTPNKNWDNDEYKIGVIEKCKKIELLLEELETSKEEPKLEQMTEAIDMLLSVFKTKRVPVDEQIERFTQLLNETNSKELFLEHLRKQDLKM